MSRMYKFFAFFALITIACGVTAPDTGGSAKMPVSPADPTSTSVPVITPVPAIPLPVSYQIVSTVYKRETPGGMVIGSFSAGVRVAAYCVDGWCRTVANPPAFFWQGCTDHPADYGCEAK